MSYPAGYCDECGSALKMGVCRQCSGLDTDRQREPDSGEFNLFAPGDISEMALSVSDDLEPARDAVVLNRSRELSLSFEVELDPRFAERETGIDTHPMPPEWRERHR